jgi:hypothetical protein
VERAALLALALMAPAELLRDLAFTDRPATRGDAGT